MLLLLIIIFTIPLLLNIRFRLRLLDTEKTIFLGLGRSGVQYDFDEKQGFFHLWNMKLKKIELGKAKKKKKVKSSDKKTDEKAGEKKSKRVIPYKRIFDILPSSMTALWRYLISLLRSVSIEEMQGDIEAGFESPDLTGKIFGYYQAAYHAVPAVAGRINYIPVWDDTRFNAQMRLSVVIPFYKIVWRTMILIFSLPLREIIKLTIGKKERSHDG